jgi:UDP-N-acetylglucosamine--N-acetylmuramyl-(pentapeptide) pyrophosphoryl-undecaprenol N-acetylglucosamine transferase
MQHTIVLAAGGTGGHIFPAEALAKKLAQQHFKVILITDRASQKFRNLPSSVQVMTLPLQRRSGGMIGKIKFIWSIFKSTLHAFRGLRRLQPSVVVGFGGYPSFPTLITAQLLRIPTIVHEQNSVLGQVNRILGRHAKCVALSFENTFFTEKAKVTAVTGTPVRSEFYTYRETTYAPPEEAERIRILITGGSQGAAIFSKIIPLAFSQLSKSIQGRLSILHQCPSADIESLKQTYANLSFRPTVIDFIPNMAEEMSAAHIVITRAGASTLAELATVGRPAILIPFLHAKDNHQWHNAQNVESTGAAWCLHQSQLTPETLASLLELTLQTPPILNKAAVKMKQLAHVNSVDVLVNLIRNIL